jgi:cell wall-associated NlpC family hydrolase
MDIGKRIEPLNIDTVSSDKCRAIERRLVSIFEEWEGTPHRNGQQVKGLAVDCVRFVSAVADELYGKTTEIVRLPQDASFHSKETCYNAFKSFMKNYPHDRVEGNLQPGDIIITGPRGGGPGHAIFTGVKYLWHCDTRAVVRTGTFLTSAGVYFPIAILRGRNRERWVR